MDDLEEYELKSYPTLKSALDLDGMSLLDVLKTCPRKIYGYSYQKNGWLEELSYAGFLFTVLVHSSKKNFEWKDVKKWTFYPCSKSIIEPDFEVWVRSNVNLEGSTQS